MHGLRVQVGEGFLHRLRSVRSLSYKNKEEHPLLNVPLWETLGKTSELEKPLPRSWVLHVWHMLGMLLATVLLMLSPPAGARPKCSTAIEKLRCQSSSGGTCYPCLLRFRVWRR